MNMNKVDYEFFNNNKYIIRSKIDEEINFWKKLADNSDREMFETMYKFNDNFDIDKDIWSNNRLYVLNPFYIFLYKLSKSKYIKNKIELFRKEIYEKYEKENRILDPFIELAFKCIKFIFFYQFKKQIGLFNI